MKPILIFLSVAFAAVGAVAMLPQDKVDSMFEDPILFPNGDANIPPFSFETLYGSRAAFTALKSPERIEIYRIDPLCVQFPVQPGVKVILDHRILSGPIEPSAKCRTELIRLFTTKDTFGDRPMCGGEPVILVRAISHRVTVDLLFCFKCDDVQIVRDDQRISIVAPAKLKDGIKVSMWNSSPQKFLQLFKPLFPHDDNLQRITPIVLGPH